MKFRITFFALILAIVFVPRVSHAAPNTSGYAWGENVGWIDFGLASTTNTYLDGYAYGENIGWISLNCLNTRSCSGAGSNPYAVTNNGNGKLSGYAWGENVGWIDFSRVNIATTTASVGQFSGYAYGENIGWISLNCSNTGTCSGAGSNPYYVSTTWRPSGGGSTYSISGTVNYYTGSKQVTGAVVNLRNSSGSIIGTVTTGAGGTYQFTNVPEGANYSIDVSKNDNVPSPGVDSSDLVKVRRHTATAEILSTIYKKIAADLNQNLSINSQDLVKARRYTSGADAWTSGGWRFYPASVSLDTGNYLSVSTTTTITNLSADSSGNNFIGIKIGDVNGSW